ncbi:MAG: hypothetical protein VKQ33_07010 [Candidatus Sericytochromatia bacterium]|nr:hypothetical protein [Candidatus Sericytochromatia bacterium]
MPVPRWLVTALVVASQAAAACGPVGPAGAEAPSGRKVPVKGSAAGRKLQPATTRLVPQSPVAAATLVGQVKLLSDLGGGLLSDNGGAVISNNSGTLVSNHGANLAGQPRYALSQQPGPTEAWLADALVTVEDARGRRLIGPDGQPLQARTDETGAYSLRATLPDESLVLRVDLFNGGKLLALVAREPSATRRVPLDTASTLGASYVLDRFVQGDQQTLDRLPAAAAETLRNRLVAAQGHLTEVPSYRPEESVALAAMLREKDPAVAASLETIKALLLGGLGDGKVATQVALNKPSALLLDRDGTLLIAEQDFGRIRRLHADGTQSLLLDGRAGEVRENLIGLTAMALAPDGALLAAAKNRRRLYRLAPGRAPEEVLGSGQDEPCGDCSGVGAPFDPQAALGLPFTPSGVAIEPGGAICAMQGHPARLVRLRPDGQVEHVPLPAPASSRPLAQAVAVGGPGDRLHLLWRDGATSTLLRREADGAWTTLAQGLHVNEGRLVVTAEGTAYVSEDDTRSGPGAISLVTASGTVTALPLPTGDGPPLQRPVGLARASDGTLYASDTERNLVFARSPEGAWRLVAGNVEALQAGGDRLTFNAPTWVVFDAEGRMLVSEGGGHAIKRWNGAVLETVAGGARGSEGDGGPATLAHLNTPGAMTLHAGKLYLADTQSKRIRAIGSDGVIRPVAGAPGEGAPDGRPLAPGASQGAFDVTLPRLSGLAIGPDGTMYWSSMSLHQIYRLDADGRIRLLAGSPTDGTDHTDGPDGPATETSLRTPAALAFRPGEPDNLYFVELASCRVRRVTGISGAAPRVETVAGLGLSRSLARMLAPEPGWEAAENGQLATEALVVMPIGLAFDAAGAMYVAEGGTTNATQLVANTEKVLGAMASRVAPVPARIRRIDLAGRIQTIVGPGGRLHTDPSAEDAFGLPVALAVDPQGRLAVVDVRSNSVRIIPVEALQ